MDEFDSLIEEPTFDDLIETDPPKPGQSTFTPEITQATSSLGQVPQEIPMQLQMQGPTASKYGMDFDPDMYISDDLPELASLRDYEDPYTKKVTGILNKNSNKNFVRRILDPTTVEPLDRGEGVSSTHSMEWGEADGKYYVYPTVIEQDGKLVDISDQDPLGYALKTGEYVEFDSAEDAGRFSSDDGYKRVWNKPERTEEEVKEKVHEDFFISEEAQRVINASAAKQPTISQGRLTDAPPRIDPTLLQPDVGPGEYLIDKLSNESLLGKASILMAGTIQAGIHGGDPLEYYRDIYDANNKTIMSYKPNELQDMATGSLAVIVDLPIFQGIGSLYNSATASSIKYATSYVSDNMVKAGMTRALADKYAQNSVVRLNSMLQSGTVLGTHAGLNDIATQLADGADLREVNWNQVLNTTDKSGKLGLSVGAFGVGANYFRSTPSFQKMIDGSVKGRLAEHGFSIASFGGEVSLFTYGDAILEGKKLSSVTGKDLAHGATTILSLKAMHAKQKLPSGKGDFNAVELDAIKKHTKNFSYKEPLKSLVEDPIAGEKLLKDPKVPFITKAKLMDMAGVNYDTPLVSDVKMVKDSNGVLVETRTKDGTLVESTRFASQSEAIRTMSRLEADIAQMDKAAEMSRMTLENQLEMDHRLEKAGIEDGISNKELINAVQANQKTAAQKKLANTCFEIYDALKAEKTEVKEGETPQEFLVKEKPVETKEINPEEIISAAKETEGKLAEVRAKRIEADKDRISSLDALTKITGQEDFAAAYRELDRMVESKEGTMDEIGERRVLRNKIREDSGPMGLAEHVTPEGIEVTPIAQLKADRLGMIKSRPATGEATAASLKEAGAKIRALKGTIGPKPGELGMSILPPQVYDVAFEMAAKTLETTGDAVLAVGRAIDAVKSTTAYRDLSDIEKDRVEKELLKLMDSQLQTEKYSDKLAELKKSNPDKYWSVDMPSAEVINKAAREGRIVDTGEGYAIVKENGDIVGVFKYELARSKEKFAESQVEAEIPAEGYGLPPEPPKLPGKKVNPEQANPTRGFLSDVGRGKAEDAGVTVKIKGGEEVVIKAELNESYEASAEGKTNHLKDSFSVYAKDADGNVIARAQVRKNRGSYYINHAETYPAHQGKGVMTSIYDYIESTGIQLTGAYATRTPDGAAFNKARSAAKAKAAKERGKTTSKQIKSVPKVSGIGQKILAEAIKKGGDRLDNFDGYLSKIYEESGFKVISRIPFDPKQAPKDMPASEKAKKPDVVFMGRGDIPAEFLNQKFKSYEEAMAYRDAIMDDINAGRPPKKSVQTKIDQSVEGKHKKNKVVVQEYTALKDQIKTQSKIAKDIDKFRKEAQAEIQKVIGGKDFQTAMGARASKTIARRVAGMDLNNPKSVNEVMNYIDRAINEAKFREELAEIDKAYDKLEAKTSPESMAGKDNSSGVLKGKGIDPAYQDKLKAIRKNMMEGDAKAAQEEINKLQEEIATLNPGDPLIDAKLARLEELSFHGLLNETSQPSLRELKSHIADIESIRKEGRTLGAAKRFIRSAERAERIQDAFDVLNAGTRKVVLDPEKSANLKTPTARKVSRWLDWSNLDSYFTLLDKMSRFDKSAGMFDSKLSRSMSEPIFAAERGEFLGRTEKQNEANGKLAEIYGTENSKQLEKVLDKNTSELHTMKWESTSIDGKKKAETLDITMNQAYKRWMELQDPSLAPSLTKQGYFDQFGNKTAKYTALEGVMTPEIKQWAEWQLNEFYPKYVESINEVYREIYGTDMPVNDKYSPIFVADKILNQDAALDQMFSTSDIRGMAGNSHLKLRTGHAKELLLLDGDRVMMNYINKMEFFKNWSGALREVNGVFGDRSIRESIRQNFGDDYVRAVDHFMDKAARSPEILNKFEKASNTLRKNFTVASLAIKPTVFVKQLTSFPAYADKVPIKNFMGGMADWANPKGWAEVTKLLNDSPYLQERYMKGWDRDVALAMQRDAQSALSGKKGNWSNTFMLLTKYGDKAAIMLGGWPVYKYHRDLALKSGMSAEDAHQAGLRKFEFATRQSQQATGPMDLSILQNSNPIMKWATMYKTSPLQYHRKVVTAARDLAFDGRNRSESLKTLLIYHAVLPQLFQLVGNGFQWDGEDQLRALKWGSATGVPMAGDALQGMFNHLSNTGFEYRPTVLTDMFKNSTKAADELVDIINGGLGPIEDVTFDDIWDHLDKLMKAGGSWTGTPADAVHNTVAGISDAIQGETNFPIRRILGWSEYALDDDRYDLLRDFPEDIRNLVENNLGNEKDSFDSLLEDQGNPETFDDLIEK